MQSKGLFTVTVKKGEKINAVLVRFLKMEILHAFTYNIFDRNFEDTLSVDIMAVKNNLHFTNIYL